MSRAWLVFHQDNPNHFAGVALFCFGSFVYSIAFLKLVARTHEHLRALHQALRWFLLLSTLALVIAFVVVWALEENSGQHASNSSTRTAYIVEHVAYITHILFYATFILYHTPNPDRPPDLVSAYQKGATHDTEPEGQDMVPLVHLVHVRHTNQEPRG